MATSDAGPSLVARLGLALIALRWALAVGDDPRHPGRAGSDVVRLFGVLLVAAHLRELVAAAWVGSALGVGLGVHGLVMVLSRAFTADLAFLVLGAAVVFAGGGRRRNLGRAFDLACVAVVPLIAVELLAAGVVRVAHLSAGGIGLGVAAVGYTWSGAILALALTQMRRAPRVLA